MWTDQLTDVTPTGAIVAAAILAAALWIAGRVAARRHQHESGTVLRRLLIGLAVATAIGVAVVGGVRSFEAVSIRFGSPLVPLTADGMIVACTALRIAALARGWRIPGALATTYLFIGGTVWLNVAAAHDWSDAIAHALAPMSYAILVEMLAHLLRLHLHLTTPPRQRVAALAWATSPVVTTRVWLHLARTGTDDPVQARALVQQLVRLSSRLRMVCSSRRPWPFGQARRARTAALQVVRDGLMTTHQLAELLPSDGSRLEPGVLLARVDEAGLRCTAPARSGAPTGRTDSARDARTGAPHRARTSTPTDTPVVGSSGPTGSSRVSGAAGGSTAERSDEDLVADLQRLGGPMSGRQVMRTLGVGTGRAKRLIEMAGWTDTATSRRHNGNGTAKPEVSEADNSPIDETEPADHYETRTNP
ncbi:MAG: DUF2637 domain-containing protein [Nocardioidaceae bacterium]